MISFDLYAGIILLAAGSWFLGDAFERGVSRHERIRAGMDALWALSWALFVVHRSRASTLAMWLLLAITVANMIVHRQLPPPRKPNGPRE